VDLLPKIKVEVVVLHEDVPKTLNAIIAAARTGETGDGKIFVLPVDDAVRVRTGEDGENAI
jgi:nitrogen regulatory protein P-II 1